MVSIVKPVAPLVTRLTVAVPVRARHALVRAHRASRSLAGAAAGVLLAGSILACGGSAATPPEDAPPRRAGLAGHELPASSPAIRGTITQVVEGDSVAPPPSTAGNPDAPVSCPPSCSSSGRPLRSILIEEVPGAASGGDKSMVTMPAGARVLRRTAAGVESAAFADLRAGQRVSAWFDGPVALSYPTRARGLVVVIEP